MSKPRDPAWGYALNCVRAYPKLKEKYEDLKIQKITASYDATPRGGTDGRTIERLAEKELPPREQQEFEAVRNALEATALYKTGEERIKLISTMYFDGKKVNIDAAGFRVNVAEATAKRWHGDFIRLVLGYLLE